MAEDVTVEHGYFDFKNIREYASKYDEIAEKFKEEGKLESYLGLNELFELEPREFLILLQIYPRLYMLAADKDSKGGGFYQSTIYPRDEE